MNYISTLNGEIVSSEMRIIIIIIIILTNAPVICYYIKIYFNLLKFTVVVII